MLAVQREFVAYWGWILDTKDEQIIDLLSGDAWLTHAEIGEAVHLSVSAVQRRIRRLREDGVIAGAKATINRAGIRKKLRLYLLLELKNDSRAQLDALTRELREQAMVSDVSLLAGRFDVIVTIDCDDMDTFTDFAMTALNENRNILHCWTLTRLKQLV